MLEFQKELEEAASGSSATLDEVEVAPVKHQSLAQKIYAENRVRCYLAFNILYSRLCIFQKKATISHDMLDKLGPKVDLVRFWNVLIYL